MHTTNQNPPKRRRHWLLATGVGLTLATLIVIGLRTWHVQRIDYIWQQAIAAIEARQYDTARLHLESILSRRPDHTDARLVLGRMHAAARLADSGDPVAHAAHAIEHLALAAAGRADDAEVQVELMSLLEAEGRLRQAAAVARRVIELDPANQGALYLVAWDNVRRERYPEAAETLAELARVQPTPSFRSLTLIAKVDEALSPGDQLQATLARAVALATALDGVQLAELSAEEQKALRGLLILAVREAPGRSTALARALDALGVAEQLGGSTLDGVSAADFAVEIAAAVAWPKPGSSDGDAASRDAQQQVSRQVETIVAAAIAEGTASPAVYYQAAAAQFEQGDVDRGLSIIDEAIAKTADWEGDGQRDGLPLRLLASRQLVLARRIDEARPHVDALLKAKETAGFGHLIAGGIAVDDMRLDDALEHFNAARSVLGDILPVHLGLAHTLTSLGRLHEAHPHWLALHAAIERLDEEQRAWADGFAIDRDAVDHALAYGFLERDDWASALPHLLALQGTRLEGSAHSMVASYLWAHRRGGEALDYLAEARERLPHDATLMRVEAAALAQLGLADEADSIVEQFAAAQPTDAASALAQARWYLSQGRHDEALALIKEHLPENAGGTGVTLLEAQSQLAAGRPAEALALARPLCDHPQSASLAAVIAVEAALAQGDAAAAKLAIDTAGRVTGQDGWIELCRARILSSQGDYARALEVLCDALRFTPTRALTRAAIIHNAARMIERDGVAVAESKIVELLAEHPSESSLLLAAADIALAQRRFDSCLTLVDRLGTVEGNTPLVGTTRARALAGQGQQSEALAEVRRVLKADPLCHPARALAAELSLAARSPHQALDHATKALSVDPPQSASLRLIQAQALAQLGRHADAVLVLEHVLAAEPSLVEPRLLLASLLAAMGQDEAALAAIRIGRTAADHPRLGAAEIELLAGLGQTDEAVARAVDFAAAHPGADAAIEIGGALYRSGQFDAAEHWAETAIDAATVEQQPLAHWLAGNVALAKARESGDRELFRAAKDHYEAVLATQPQHLAAGNNLAWILSEVFGQHDEAQAIAEGFVQQFGHERLPASLVDTLATIYRRTGQLDQARSLLEAAAAAHPDEPLVKFQLGMLYAQSERPTAARRALIEALRMGLPDELAAEARQQLASLAGAATSG